MLNMADAVIANPTSRPPPIIGAATPPTHCVTKNP